MTEKNQSSLEEIRSEHEITRKKYELEFDLERFKLSREQEIDNMRRAHMEKVKEKYLLREMKLNELIQKLEIENNRLKKNLLLLENERRENSVTRVKLAFYISVLLGATSFVFAILPFFKVLTNLPEVIISISLVVLFIAGIWINASWNKVTVTKGINHVLHKEMIEASDLYNYISDVIKSYRESYSIESTSKAIDE